MDHKLVSSIIELQFLPSLYYWALLGLFQTNQIEQCENYNKGSFRNKCLINSNQEHQYLIIPLQKGKNRSQPIRDVKVSYDVDWIGPMKNRMQTEFGALPYFEYYASDMELILHRKWNFLFDLNRTFLEYLLSHTGLKNVTFTEEYHKDINQSTKDLRDRITPRFFRDNSELLDPVELDIFSFIPAHSIIETLFTYGPETEVLLTRYKAYLLSSYQDLF